MGRAYLVRKDSIQKEGAKKGKLYSMYSREIYQAAKNGGTDLSANLSLKNLIAKAKTEEIPSDIIKRALDKVNSGVDENYQPARYEIFGVGGSNYIIDTLTDNTNRTLSDIRTILNKVKLKMGGMNSISYNYDNLSIVSFKYSDEEEVMVALLNDLIEIEDIESEDGIIFVYGLPTDLHAIKESIEKLIPDVKFLTEEISLLPKDKVKLSSNDEVEFLKVLDMFEDMDDTKKVYYNVEIDS